MLESRAAIQAEASYAYDFKLDRQHLALFASWVIAGGMVDCCDGTVGESLGVEPSSLFCCAVVPKTNHVLSHHLSPLLRRLSDTSNRPRTVSLDIPISY